MERPGEQNDSVRQVEPGRKPEPGWRDRSSPYFDLVVLAASADGVQALGQILSTLPVDWPIPVAVVQHRPPVQPNYLPQVLGRRTPLPVRLAEAGETLQPGTVYLSQPDRHLILEPDRTLTYHDGRRIRHLRSSAIPLLSSAAGVLGKRLIAVVLTGSGSDGTDGVQAVRDGGGIVIAQDPFTTRHPGMPSSAIRTGAVHYVLPLTEIGPALRSLVLEGRFSPGAEPDPKAPAPV
jgi:two-component system chemotaxis response regulator CheB